jgi:hypothetical protein
LLPGKGEGLEEVHVSLASNGTDQSNESSNQLVTLGKSFFPVLPITHKMKLSWVQWLTSVILPTQEVEIGRIKVPGQFMQKVHKTPSQPKKNWVW